MNRDRAIAWWLIVCAAMIFLMVVIGGITRLTESGLSITEWQPIEGVLPPLSLAQWQDAFARYQAIPQFHAIHAGMTLAQFKGIYFWEYLHRLLGRLIGIVFLLPFLYFLIRRRVGRSLWPKLALSVRARRAARRARLVHGGKRPRASHRGQPVPPRRASLRGHRDLRRDPVGRVRFAVAARRGGPARRGRAPRAEPGAASGRGDARSRARSSRAFAAARSTTLFR